MSDKTAIANIALTTLGEKLIASIDEELDRARVLKARFDDISDAVLRDHPWNCALVRTSLAADAVAPVWKFANAFTMPTDPFALRVLEANTDEKWRVEGRKIVTDAGAPLEILYIARITDTAQWDANLVQAVGARLAHAVAFRLTQNRTKESDALQLYAALLRNAKGIDAAEGTTDDPPDGVFLTARS